MDFEIIDPLKEYKDFEDKLKSQADSYIDGLVKSTGVDEEQNAISVEEYKDATIKADYAIRQANKSRKKRTVAIVFMIIGLLAVAFGIVGIVDVLQLDLPLFVYIISIVCGAVLFISMVAVICAKLNKEIRERSEVARQLVEEREAKLDECYEQVAPLNNAFNEDMTIELINNTLPSIKLEKNFSATRSKYLNENYGFDEDTDSNQSSEELLSGTINKCPFFTERDVLHEMGSKHYEGALEVEWVEYEKDSQGNVYEVTKTQVLRAGVDKPYPEYYGITRTTFFNEAGTDLFFSRSSKLAKGMSDKQRERLVAKGEKKLDKMSKKALSKGDTFVKSSNAEFDVLYGATDRSNELQFRLLFTPLAQKNIVALLKDREYYGDDFDFIKSNYENVIYSNHAQKWDFSRKAENYYSYDAKEIREKFIKYNTDFFKNLYFELAPVFAIPLYQQTKPQNEEKSQEGYPNVSLRQAMVLANAIGESAFENSQSKTSSILKCRYDGKVGSIDRYMVTAHSYMTQRRIDYVSVRCDNGKYYDVPVEWDEYLPIQNSRQMCLVELAMNSQEYSEAQQEEDFVQLINRASQGPHVYKSGILAYVGDITSDVESSFAKYRKN